ncbi:hypothetical protein ABFX02_10G028600 [Erythranthe guttata]
MSSMIRKVFSTVLSRAVRPISSPRMISSRSMINSKLLTATRRRHGGAFNPRIPFFSSHHHFCTDTRKLLDYKLVTTLNSQIKLEKTMFPVPADFPFTIEDEDPNSSEINLTREIDGERIDVLVRIEDDSYDGRSWEEYSSSDEEADEESSTADNSPFVKLDVNISKEDRKKLEFQISASSDDIRINHMLVWDTDSDYPCGPYFVKSGSDLETDLRGFLEIRGVDKKYVDFLYKYMRRSRRNYKRRPVVALEKLKKFVKD